MSDTSPEIQAIQDEIHRRMTGEERLKLAFELSDTARAFAMAGLRQRQIEDAAKVLRVRARSLDWDYLEEWVGQPRLHGRWAEVRAAAGIDDRPA